MTRMQSDPDRYSMRRPAIAAILAAGVFLLDTLAPADIAVAVLYSAVVLLSIDFPWAASFPRTIYSPPCWIFTADAPLHPAQSRHCIGISVGNACSANPPLRR